MGGRPKEEGGHKAKKLTLCCSIVKLLENAPNQSKFIEACVRSSAGIVPKKGEFIVGIPELEVDSN